MDPLSELDLKFFHLQYRLMLVENLVLKLALLEPAQHRGLSVRGSVAELTDWLDKNSAKADSSFATAFGDPAMTALFADETKGIVDTMKEDVESLAADMENLLASRAKR